MACEHFPGVSLLPSQEAQSSLGVKVFVSPFIQNNLLLPLRLLTILDFPLPPASTFGDGITNELIYHKCICSPIIVKVKWQKRLGASGGNGKEGKTVRLWERPAGCLYWAQSCSLISCDLLHVVWCNEQQRFSLHLFNLPLEEKRRGSFVAKEQRGFLCNTCQGYLPVAGTMPGIHRANRVYE